MADYILGAVLVVLFILAARSYFGKKYKRRQFFAMVVVDVLMPNSAVWRGKRKG